MMEYPTLIEIQEAITNLKNNHHYGCIDMAWCSSDCQKCAQRTIREYKRMIKNGEYSEVHHEQQ